MFKQSDKIVVKRSIGKGLGVFATKSINKDEIIESSPIIMIDDSEIDLDNKMFNYIYDVNGKSAIGLGYLSLYNHSNKPNAFARYDSNRRLSIVALKNVKINEEILICYYQGAFNS